MAAPRMETFQFSLNRRQAAKLKALCKLQQVSVQEILETACTPMLVDDNKGLRWFRCAMAQETFELALKVCDGNHDLIEDQLDQLAHQMFEKEAERIEKAGK